MAASKLCLTEVLEMFLVLVNSILTPTRKLEEALQKNAFRVECCKLISVTFSFGVFLRDLWSQNCVNPRSTGPRAEHCHWPPSWNPPMGCAGGQAGNEGALPDPPEEQQGQWRLSRFWFGSEHGIWRDYSIHLQMCADSRATHLYTHLKKRNNITLLPCIHSTIIWFLKIFPFFFL